MRAIRFLPAAAAALRPPARAPIARRPRRRKAALLATMAGVVIALPGMTAERAMAGAGACLAVMFLLGAGAALHGLVEGRWPTDARRRRR